MNELFYDDLTEIYVLDNLFWRVPIHGDEYSYTYISQKTIKRINEEDNAPAFAEPVVREICGKCGGYGGEQLEDGWFSCYRCCERGYEYTPLDLYLMEQAHLDALEDNYQHDMRKEELRRAVRGTMEEFMESDMARVHAIDRILSPEKEVEDDIPF